jgi:hypothetical protein
MLATCGFVSMGRLDMLLRFFKSVYMTKDSTNGIKLNGAFRI